MAHLEVKPKNGTPWWVWLILALVALAILLFSLRRCNNDRTENNKGKDTLTTSTANQKDAVAMTQPNWNSVNFNSPVSADPDITDKDIVVRNAADYTIFTLGENILFATDDNKIQGSSEAKLKRIVEVLDKRYEGSYIGIFGNTDSTGTTTHNKKLGAERAAAVQEWLINRGGIEKDRLSIHSVGENKPVATNSNESGRQQNRNVEIVAFKQK